MKLSDIRLLFDYNDWANDLLLAKAAELPPELLTRPTSFSWGRLSGTLVHTLYGEYLWRNLCQHQQVFESLPETETFPTLESIVAFWQGERSAMRAYLDSLTDADMESIITYDTEDGRRERVLWHCLVHVVNHGTQHRSESAAMLTNFGYSPGGIDFTLYLNSR